MFVGTTLVAEELPPEVELEELRIIVRTLAEENRQLKEALAALQAAATSSAGTPNVPAPEPSPETVSTSSESSSRAEVIYVNPTWHYVVVNRGSSIGVKKGQLLSITRDGVLIAKGAITDVKTDQSVAELDLQSLGAAGLYPKEGDLVQGR